MTSGWSIKKKIIIGILATVLIVALVFGVVWLAVFTSRGSVLVIEASEANYGYDSDYESTMEGTISTGTSQEITTEQGSKVEQFYVSQGDYVTAGTRLLTFDVTEAQLALDQANITLQGYEVSLKSASDALNVLNAAVEVTQTITVTEEDGEEASDAATDDETEGDAEDIEAIDEAEDENASQTKDASQVVTETVYRTSDGMTYSIEELNEQKKALQEEIVDAQTDIKAANLEIERARRNLEACTVYATLDGYVTKLTTDFLPSDTGEFDTSGVILRVSAMDGLYVNSALNEWMLDSYGVGDVVYVTNWLSGGIYEARITYVSPYNSDYYSQIYGDYSGSAASYYPFTAIIEAEDTGLASGDSVEVSFSYDNAVSAADYEEDEDVLYLLKAFVISENGRKYVYVANENDRLEKREVATGKQSSETIEIQSGLSESDYIAFPYAKNVREGAKVRIGNIEELYEDD